jgi:hypothetical protein
MTARTIWQGRLWHHLINIKFVERTGDDYLVTFAGGAQRKYKGWDTVPTWNYYGDD